jgi:hypothetical protein
MSVLEIVVYGLVIVTLLMLTVRRVSKKKVENRLPVRRDVVNHVHSWYDFGSYDHDTNELVMRKACTQCGFISGSDDMHLNDDQLASLVAQKQLIEDTQAFQNDVHDEILSKWNNGTVNTKVLEAVIDESLTRGMRIKQDLYVKKLGELSAELRKKAEAAGGTANRPQ